MQSRRVPGTTPCTPPASSAGKRTPVGNGVLGTLTLIVRSRRLRSHDSTSHFGETSRPKHFRLTHLVLQQRCLSHLDQHQGVPRRCLYATTLCTGPTRVLACRHPHDFLPE